MKKKIKDVVQKYDDLLTYKLQYKIDFEFKTLRDTMAVFLIMVFAFLLVGWLTGQLSNLHFVILSIQAIMIATFVLYKSMVYKKVKILAHTKLPIAQNIIYETVLFVLPFLFGQTIYFFIYLKNYINAYFYLAEAILVIFMWVVAYLVRRFSSVKLPYTRLVTNSIFVFAVFAYGAYIWNIYQIDLAYAINALTIVSFMATRTFLEFKSDKENSWPVRGKTYRPILTLLFIAVGVWAVIISDKTFAEANSYDVLYHKAMLGSEANIVDTVDVNLRNPATRQNLFDFNGKLYYFNHDYEYEIWVYDYNFDFLYRLDDFSFFISDMFMCNSTLYVFADYSNPEISDRIYRLGEDDVFYYVMDLDMPDIINLLQTDEGYVYFDYQDWWGDYYIDGKTEKSIRISTFNEYSIHNANDYEDNEIIYMNDDCLICTKDGVLTILRNFENEHSYFKYQSGVVCVGSVDDLKIYTVDDYINGGTPLFAYEFDGYKLYRLKDIYISNGRYVINTYGYDSEYTRSMWEANTYESSCSFVFSSEGELESAFIKNDYLYIGENNTILSVYDDSEEEYTYYAVDMNDLGNVAYAKSGDYRSQAVYLIAIVVFTFAFVDTNLLNWLSRIINDSRGDFLINDTEDRNK